MDLEQPRTQPLRKVSKLKLEDHFDFVSSANQPSSCLGKGAFGDVSIVKRKGGKGRKYALKTIPKKCLLEHSSEEELRKEIEFHKSLEHSHILRLYTALEDSENYYLITEYAENGNLASYLKKRKQLPEMEAFVYFFQTCIGVDYLHKQGMWHLNLKTENLLLDKDGNIKISDSIWCAEAIRERNFACGEIDYMAPEMIQKKPCGAKNDIWALGVLLYELLHGIKPFTRQTTEEKAAEIMDNNFTIFAKCSDECKDFIMKLLRPVSLHRMSFTEIFTHPWMKKFEQKFNMKIEDYVYEPNKLAFRKSKSKIEEVRKGPKKPPELTEMAFLGPAEVKLSKNVSMPAHKEEILSSSPEEERTAGKFVNILPPVGETLTAEEEKDSPSKIDNFEDIKPVFVETEEKDSSSVEREAKRRDEHEDKTPVSPASHPRRAKRKSKGAIHEIFRDETTVIESEDPEVTESRPEKHNVISINSASLKPREDEASAEEDRELQVLNIIERRESDTGSDVGIFRRGAERRSEPAKMDDNGSEMHLRKLLSQEGRAGSDFLDKKNEKSEMARDSARFGLRKRASEDIEDKIFENKVSSDFNRHQGEEKKIISEAIDVIAAAFEEIEREKEAQKERRESLTYITAKKPSTKELDHEQKAFYLIQSLQDMPSTDPKEEKVEVVEPLVTHQKKHSKERTKSKEIEEVVITKTKKKKPSEKKRHSEEFHLDLKELEKKTQGMTREELLRYYQSQMNKLENSLIETKEHTHTEAPTRIKAYSEDHGGEEVEVSTFVIDPSRTKTKKETALGKGVAEKEIITVKDEDTEVKVIMDKKDEVTYPVVATEITEYLPQKKPTQRKKRRQNVTKTETKVTTSEVMMKEPTTIVTKTETRTEVI